MAQQTLSVDRWVVALDGPDDGYDLAGCEVVHTPPHDGCSLAENVRSACDYLGRLTPSDVVLILEDDDYYAPAYVATLAPLTLDRGLVGSLTARWYTVSRRRWRLLQLRSFACLCQTAIRGDRLPELMRAAGHDYSVDSRLWLAGGESPVPGLLGDFAGLHIGVKGIPWGAQGYSPDHRQNSGTFDPHFEMGTFWGLPRDPYFWLANPKILQASNNRA